MEKQSVKDSLVSINFYAGLVHSEIDKLNELIEPFLQEGSAPTNETLMQFVRLMAELSARVNLIEQAAEQQLLAENPLDVGPLLLGALTIPASRLDVDGLHMPENELDDESLCWTQKPDITVRLPLFRPKCKRLRVYFQSIIKPEYTKSLHLEIDGEQLRHRIRKMQDSLCIECIIPPASDLAMSELSIKLPDVHSPKELGVSDDNRKLGIALDKICVDDVPGSFLTRLLRLAG